MEQTPPAPLQAIALGRQMPKTIQDIEEPRLIHHPRDHGSIKQRESAPQHESERFLAVPS